MTPEAQPARSGETPAGHLGYAMFPSSDQAPGDARRWAHELLAWLDESALFSADVMVSELATNAFLHTTSPEIWVEITHIESLLRVEVADDGSGDWDEESAEREGGRGLELVKLLSTRWGVNHADVTRVWFEMKTAGHVL
jgi:two-component sensor histidine kinase